jgi:hypothetical protein
LPALNSSEGKSQDRWLESVDNAGSAVSSDADRTSASGEVAMQTDNAVQAVDRPSDAYISNDRPATMFGEDETKYIVFATDNLLSAAHVNVDAERLILVFPETTGSLKVRSNFVEATSSKAAHRPGCTSSGQFDVQQQGKHVLPRFLLVSNVISISCFAVAPMPCQ